MEFAHFWGKDFKKGYSGCYDIYRAKLDFENCINAVFDEEGYFFLRDKIEEAISFFKEKKMDVTLEMVNRFLADNIWNKLGIPGIQIVLFNLRNSTNFELYLEEQT